MTLPDLIVTILFVGFGAAVGAASGSTIGEWCGGIMGFAFTLWFHGTTKTGGRVRVLRWHHRVWLVRLDSSIDTFHLVAAIAFIHRERLRHG